MEVARFSRMTKFTSGTETGISVTPSAASRIKVCCLGSKGAMARLVRRPSSSELDGGSSRMASLPRNKLVGFREPRELDID